MKNYPAYMLSITLVIAMVVGFSSCKDDDPPVKPKLSFLQATLTVDESEGVIEAKLVLDKAHGKDLNVEYTLGGTASDQDAVGTANADYEVVGDHGLIVIPAGETSGAIGIEIYNDTGFEPNETIEISILDVNTGDVEITAENEMEITITNDDAQLIASFPNTTLTVNEDDAQEALLIAVQLDKVAPADITLEYTLEGTALDSTFAFNEGYPASYYDYYVDGVTGEVVIPSGSSTANIELQIYTDFLFENDETIVITLTATNQVQLGTNKTMTITLEQQDGKVIALVWDDTYTDVDMDMFLWIGDDTTNLPGLLATALTPRTTPQQELIFIPSLLTDGAFGLSYVYYSGTADPMNFEVHFADFAAGVLEPEADRDIFAATYTLANINAWDQSDLQPIVVHRFLITAGAYSYGKIVVPSSGSRIKRQTLPGNIRRIPGLPSSTLF